MFDYAILDAEVLQSFTNYLLLIERLTPEFRATYIYDCVLWVFPCGTLHA